MINFTTGTNTKQTDWDELDRQKFPPQARQTYSDQARALPSLISSFLPMEGQQQQVGTVMPHFHARTNRYWFDLECEAGLSSVLTIRLQKTQLLLPPSADNNNNNNNSLWISADGPNLFRDLQLVTDTAASMITVGQDAITVRFPPCTAATTAITATTRMRMRARFSVHLGVTVSNQKLDNRLCLCSGSVPGHRSRDRGRAAAVAESLASATRSSS